MGVGVLCRFVANSDQWGTVAQWLSSQAWRPRSPGFETLAILVSMPVEVKCPTQGVNV